MFVAPDTGHRYLDGVFARHAEALGVDTLEPREIADTADLALPWSRMEWNGAPASVA